MPNFRGSREAFGAPGTKPTWTQGNKEGVGTAYSEGSRIWYTLSRGILNEIYHPTVDCPQTRDLRLLFADGKQLFLDEARDLTYKMERIEPSQGYRLTKRDLQGRFSLVEEVISDPVRPCVLLHASVEGDERFLEGLKVYVYCAPHLRIGGAGNNAHIAEVCGRELLVAEKNGEWLAVGASHKFARLSCGYVGASDGYTDLSANFRMTHEFDQAPDGNVALTAELTLPENRVFTVGVAFGDSLGSAVSVLFQSLGVSFPEQRKQFVEQWKNGISTRKDLTKVSGDDGRLYSTSYNVLLTHEDSTYQGAFVASLSIPWAKLAATKTAKAAIIWSGRETWSRAPWHC